MCKLMKPLSILLSLTMIISMLAIIPKTNAAAADAGSSLGENTVSYSYDAISGELRLLSGDFSNNKKWGEDVRQAYVKSVTAEAGVTFSGDCGSLFKSFVSCERIDLSQVNTAAVTDMSEMFRFCYRLRKLDISGFDIGSTTVTSLMFMEADSLSVLTLPAETAIIDAMYLRNDGDPSGWIVSGDFVDQTVVSGTGSYAVIPASETVTTYLHRSAVVKNYSYDSETYELRLASGCFSAGDKWDTTEVPEHFVKSVVAGDGVYFCGDCTSLFKEFYRCERMDFSRVDTSLASGMKMMFHDCEALNTLDLSGFDISRSTADDALVHLFTYTYALQRLTLSPKMPITEIMGLANYQWVVEGDFEHQTVVSGSGSAAVIPAPSVSTTYVRKALYQPSYTFDSDSGELTLTSGYFSAANNWDAELVKVSVKSVTAEDGVFFVGDCSGLFEGFSVCESMDLSAADASAMTKADEMFAFDDDLSRITLPAGFGTDSAMRLNNGENGCGWIVENDYTKRVVSGTGDDAVIAAPEETTTYLWKSAFADHPFFIIGGSGYDSLNEALRSASDGDTVILTADVFQTTECRLAHTVEDQGESVHVKLDLNGHTLANDCNSNLFYVDGRNHLEICDSSEGEEKGSIRNNYADNHYTYYPWIVLDTFYSHLTLSDGIAVTGFSQITMHDTAALTVNDAQIETNYSSAICFDASSGSDCTIEINGGKIESPTNYLGEGFFKSKIYSYPHITISGGTMIYNMSYFLNKADGANVSITGGTFSSDVSDYVADGFACLDNGDHTYSVVEKVYVAQVGDTQYLRFSDAVNAANGADIILLADIADAYTMSGAGAIRVCKGRRTFDLARR